MESSELESFANQKLVGEFWMEFEELEKMTKENQKDTAYTMTVGCGGFLTIICC